MSDFPPPSLVSGDDESDAKGNRSMLRSVESTEAACAAVVAGPVVDISNATLMCRRGVHDRIRRTYWKLMIGLFPHDVTGWEAIESKKASEYKELVRLICTLDENNNVVICENSNREIDIDIPRTMPTMHFFNLERDFTVIEGIPTTFSPMQQCLRRILHTFAGVNKGFGYVQGMNELVGHLLFAFTCGEPSAVDETVEADVFFFFQRMLSHLGDDFCRTLDFDKNTGVMSTIRNFERIVQFVDPELWDHLETNEIRSEFYAFRWLTLLFTQEFNVPDVFRIWDFIFSFGEDICGVVIYIAAAMLVYKRDDILALDHLGTILPFLQSYPSCDVVEFLDIASTWVMRFGFQPIAWLKSGSREDANKLRERYKFSGAGGPSWKENLTGWVSSMWKS